VKVSDRGSGNESEYPGLVFVFVFEGWIEGGMDGKEGFSIYNMVWWDQIDGGVVN